MAQFFRKRSLLQSQKLLRRERVWQWAKIIFVIILLIGLIWGLSALSFSPKLNLQTVLVTGNSAVSTDDVLNVVREATAGRNFWIFSSANTLWYPKQQIIDTLKYSHSWIDSVSVSRVNFSTLAVKITERVPVAVWCGVSLEQPQPCKLMDSRGYLFAPAPDFSGAAYIKLYGPLTSADWRGPQFFSQIGLIHILDLNKGLTEIGMLPISATVIDPSAYNMYIGSSTYISAQISDAVPGIISNLSSLLSQKMFATSSMSNFSNLLYIDTRFGNKLFYKFK